MYQWFNKVAVILVFFVSAAYIYIDPVGLISDDRYDYFSENIVLCSVAHSATGESALGGVGLGLYWPLHKCREVFTDSMFGIVLTKKDLSPLSDENWKGGISKIAPGFLVSRSVFNFEKYVPGQYIYFPDGGRRAIVGVFAGAEYLNVQLSGDLVSYGALTNTKKAVSPILGSEYLLYTSQVGASGYLYSALYNLTGWTDVQKYRILPVLLSAVTLTLLLVILYIEFGIFPAFAVAASLLFSPWWMDFAKNIYWNSWTWLVPLLVVCCWLGGSISSRGRNIVFFVAYAASIALKSSFGYEYLSTIIVMSALPVLYIGLRDGMPIKTIFYRAIAVGISSLLGFASILLLHAMLRADTLYQGLQGIAIDITRRTYASGDAVKESLGNGLPLTEIAGKYFGMFYQPILPGLDQPFYIILVPILVVSIVMAILLNGRPRSLAFVFMASITAPMSWVILAKGHAAMHLHLNPVLWDMPVMPVAALMIAVGLQQCGHRLKYFRISQ